MARVRDVVPSNVPARYLWMHPHLPCSPPFFCIQNHECPLLLRFGQWSLYHDQDVSIHCKILACPRHLFPLFVKTDTSSLAGEDEGRYVAEPLGYQLSQTHYFYFHSPRFPFIRSMLWIYVCMYLDRYPISTLVLSRMGSNGSNIARMQTQRTICSRMGGTPRWCELRLTYVHLRPSDLELRFSISSLPAEHTFISLSCLFVIEAYSQAMSPCDSFIFLLRGPD
ncbi:hypothetical protein EV702DRAFT_112861 [Suillus placidus]|uniref:Uncharacterized protein n=1 Tax=Suillus placidus TaxID=48579 RepID=A0A9P7D4A8_9AGAM|nr:hypothetical protein EV702DRAFT_112861 [Suillus placidus]